MNQRLRIPEHEPEIVAAGARHYPASGDEKVATTSLQEIEYDGIKISSRYGKAHEMRLMCLMVLDLTMAQRRAIKTLWCDSKASFCFSIALRRWDRNMAEDIGCAVSNVAIAEIGGHNGVFVEAEACDLGDWVEVCPYWDMDEEEQQK